MNRSKSEPNKVWTYCYTISSDALDFVKSIYENTTNRPKFGNDKEK